jgi:phospholipase C
MKYMFALCGIGIAALAGCAATEGNTNTTCEPLASGSAAAMPQWQGTVFTIVMENKDRTDIVGNADAPFINQVIGQNALAAGYHDAYVHPSEPNYLWMAAGENFGVLDDSDPIDHHIASTSHIADQIELAGLTWKSYQESMGSACGLSSHGEYAAKHNPFVFFNDVNGWDGSAFHPEQRCNAHVVDYAQLDTDLAANTLPKYAFITPNLMDDMHDGTIAEGDAWLARELPKILGSEAFNHGGIVFLLWDEGSGLTPGDDPPFIAISANAKGGYVSTIDYDTSSYLLTVEKMLGLAPLPCGGSDAATIPSMDDLFSVSLTAPGTSTSNTGTGSGG